MRLVNNAQDFLKCTSKPTYITHKIFSKNYAAIHEIKPALILSKPIYVGSITTFMTTLVRNILMLNCYSLTQTVLLMK